MIKEQKDLNRKQLHQLLDAVLDVNGFEDRQREITGDKPTVFANFFGHVAHLEVLVFETGWEKGTEIDQVNDIYINEPMDITDLLDKLSNLKEVADQ